MSVENVVNFFKKLEQDEAFRIKLAKDERLKNKSFDSLRTVAAAEGFSFSEDEFKQAQEDMKDIELSEEELDKVAGGVGIGIGVCLLVGYSGWGKDGKLKLLSNEDGPGVAMCLLFGMN